jgi:hypothetical protein
LRPLDDPRRFPAHPRGRWYRIRFDAELCCELERVAAERHVAPEILLNAIGCTVIGDRLVDAVLDDQN